MKKGFTLIELLAVIVILAIIAIIATPIVINIIEDSKKSVTLRSAEFYLDAVEQALANEILKDDTLKLTACNIQSNGNLLCNGNNREIVIQIEGEKPTSGQIEFEKSNPKYVEIIYGDKVIVKNKERSFKYSNKRICKAVEEATTGNIPEGKFEPGDEYICKVNDIKSYRFFVLGEDENDSSKVNLILYANINKEGMPIDSSEVIINNSAWISKADYKDNNTYGTYGNVNKGPISAINFANEATKTWTNIENLNETYNDEGGRFVDFSLTGKARIPKLNEMVTAKCDIKNFSVQSCPLWIINYTNLQTYYKSNPYKVIINSRGYWILSSSSSDKAYFAYYDGYVSPGAYVDGIYGIRPVISVSKSNIS